MPHVHKQRTPIKTAVPINAAAHSRPPRRLDVPRTYACRASINTSTQHQRRMRSGWMLSVAATSAFMAASRHVCTHICTHVCTNVYIYMPTHMSAQMSAHTPPGRVCAYGCCTHICAHAGIHVHEHVTGGGKATLFEGGMRAVSFVTGDYFRPEVQTDPGLLADKPG